MTFGVSTSFYPLAGKQFENIDFFMMLLIFYIDGKERRNTAMAMENLPPERPFREAGTTAQHRTMGFVSAGSLAEGILGVAAIALSIIGLAGVFSSWMVAITAIVVGVAFLFEGGAMGARFSGLFSSASGGRVRAFEFGGGMTLEFLAGVTGIVLGILALLGIYSLTLVSIAAIVFGGAMVIGMGAHSRLNDMQIERDCETMESRQAARVALTSFSSVQALIGLGGITLGILAVIGMVPLTLTLIAFLGMGFSGLMSGSAMSGRLLSAFNCE